MHRIPHGIQDAVQGPGPPLNPARSSCSLRDNGSHVELATSYESPGTAHGIPHRIPHGVLKSTRNSGSRTQQDPALKSAWNSRSLRGHGPRVRYMHVTLNPARGLVSSVRSDMWAPGSGTISCIQDHVRVSGRHRSVGNHWLDCMAAYAAPRGTRDPETCIVSRIESHMELRSPYEVRDTAWSPAWPSRSRTTSRAPNGIPRGFPDPARDPGSWLVQPKMNSGHTTTAMIPQWVPH